MTPRLLAGYALVLAGFVLVFLLAYGVVEPCGSTAAARDVAGLLAAAAPGLLIPLAVFLLGLWLVKGARRR